MSELPAGPGWYEDEHDPVAAALLRRRRLDLAHHPATLADRRRLDHRASHPGRHPRPGRQPGRLGAATASSARASGARASGRAAACRPPATTPTSRAGSGPRDDVLPDGAVLAEWWRRLVGRILDIIVTTVITLVIAFPWRQPRPCRPCRTTSQQACRRRSPVAPRRPDRVRRADPLEVVLPITLISIAGVARLRDGRSSTTRGATPGKMVVGTVVRRVDGPGQLDRGHRPQAPGHRRRAPR